MKVWIAAGGTGGHIFPGVAIAQGLRKFRSDIEVEFVGSSRGLERGIIPKLGWKLLTIDATSWKDKGVLSKLAVMLKMPFLISKALFLLRRSNVDLIISLGGYASVPALVAARLLGIVITLVEPNAIAGFTTRKLGVLAKRVFIAYPQARAYFRKEKIIESGIPLREEIVSAVKGMRVGRKGLVLLCFGGAQGALSLNRTLVQSLKLLKGMEESLSFLHMVGKNEDMKAIEAEYKKFGFAAEVFEWCDRMWDLYGRADLLLARSGAITLAEASAFSLPMILVPYPWAADDHQLANAKHFVNKGAALLIENKDFTSDRLASEIKRICSSPELMVSMANAAMSLARLDAAEVVVRESLETIEEGT